MLLIEPSREDQQEIALLKRRVKKQSHVSLDADPDFGGEASRLHMLSVELLNEENRRNQRSSALAERYYAKRSKELNSFGLGH
jgi:hypothetical protein